MFRCLMTGLIRFFFSLFMQQEGRVYLQIISPQLNVGGNLSRNASNGNTNILINNREITRKELWILKVLSDN